jgi:hypothetical protein
VVFASRSHAHIIMAAATELSREQLKCAKFATVMVFGSTIANLSAAAKANIHGLADTDANVQAWIQRYQLAMAPYRVTRNRNTEDPLSVFRQGQSPCLRERPVADVRLIATRSRWRTLRALFALFAVHS